MIKVEKTGGNGGKRKAKELFLKRILPVCVCLVLTVGLCLGWTLLTAPSAPEKVADPEPAAAKPAAIDPESSFAPFITRQLKEAWEENNDVVGWLKVDGCEIDNRVFQSYDNDYYLRKDEQGAYDVWGCYFLDYINRHDETVFSDRVMIIYGHSLDDYTDSEKFSKLKRYKSSSFAYDHPTIRFSMLYADYEWEIFGCCDMPVTKDYIDPNPGDNKFKKTMNYIIDNSYVDFGVDVGPSDQVLILSTCTSNDSIRFVVAAKLVGEVEPEPEESEEV